MWVPWSYCFWDDERLVHHGVLSLLLYWDVWSAGGRRQILRFIWKQLWHLWLDGNQPLTLSQMQGLCFGVEKHDKFGRIINNILRLSSLLDEPQLQTKSRLFWMEWSYSSRRRAVTWMLGLSLLNLSTDNIVRRMPHMYSKAKRHVIISSKKFKGFWDLQGYLHPQLENQAPETGKDCWESLIMLLKCLSQEAGGKLDSSRHHDMLLIYEILKDAFKCITVLSRASRSFSETLRNARDRHWDGSVNLPRVSEQDQERHWTSGLRCRRQIQQMVNN